MLRTLVIAAAALVCAKPSDTDAAYKRSRLAYEAKKNEPFVHIFEPRDFLKGNRGCVTRWL